MQQYNINDTFDKWESDVSTCLASYKGIAIACSGGADSTALLHHLLLFRQQRQNLPLAIAHVNYGLRKEENKQEQFFLEKLAVEHNLPFFLHQVLPKDKIKKKPPNTQAWARKIRYDHFSTLAQKGWAIAIAHTQNDVGENILLRLCRGSSPGSLSGMTTWFNPYWRPFLNIPKIVLMQWLKRRELTYCKDSSNEQMTYTRNIIRKQTLPELEKLFPGALQRLTRCAEEAREMTKFMRHTVGITNQIHTNSTLNQQSLPKSFFLQFNQSVSTTLLADFIRHYSQGSIIPQHKLLSTILDKLRQKNTTSWQIQLGKNIFCRIEQQQILLSPLKKKILRQNNTRN